MTLEKLLIKKVKENDVLYNAKSTYYRDSEVRQQTWQKIGKELNLKADEARSTWDKLRRCFINARNRRRIKEHESGIVIHPWKYERDMAFLWPFVERNRRTIFLKSDGTTSYENCDSDPDDVGKEIGFESTLTDSADNVKAEVEDLQGYTSPGRSVSYIGNDDMPMVETMLGNKRDYPQYDDENEKTENRRKRVQHENTLLDLDESDLFFMSMSKMTKSLPELERAKVQLAVSNAVLQAVIKLHEN